MKKRIVAFLLALILIVSVLPTTGVPEVQAATGNIVINGIDIGYADGGYFTKNGSSCASSYWASGRCHGHDICVDATNAHCNCMRYWPSISNCQVDLCASQCMGFARYCQWKVYGVYDAQNYSKFTDLTGNLSASQCTASTLKTKLLGCAPATHIRTGDGGHSLVIRNSTDYGVDLSEANYDGYCRIRNITYSWAGFAEYLQGRSGVKYAYSWKGSTSSNVTVSNTYSAELPFKGYLKNDSTIYPYSSANLTATSGGEIWSTDECTISEVYTNGACKVTYPVSSGTKTAYTQLSNFLTNTTAAPAAKKISSAIQTYVRASTSSTAYKKTVSGSTVYVIGASGTMSQIIFPVSGTNYLGWVNTTTLNNATTYYTVSYNANGGSGAPAAQTKAHGATLTLSTAKPTRTGYTFLGWGTSASATTATYQPGASYTANANITLYAVWKANTYTVSYNANGGTGAPGSQTKTHDVTLTLSTAKPTRTGYTFLGWSTNKSATTATYQPGGSFTTNANTTLYAIWKANTYTITYNANGGSGAPAAQTKTHDVTLTLSTTKPTRTGYTFLGWSTNKSATTATYQPGGSFTTNANTTLYAIWKINTYTVTYHANGGTGAPSSQVKDYGVALTLSTAKPTRAGYTFLGWGTSASATTATYQPGGSYTANASITLYAVWKANTYTVSYNANGGSGAPAAQTKTHDVTLTLSTTKPTRTGYTFLGWSTNKSATTATYQPGGSFTTNANTTLYAIWKINTYTVTYHANGGTGVPSSQTKVYGVALTLSTTKPTRAGYTFLGWSTNKSATTATYQPGGSFTTNANTTLYAIWKADTYTVTYHANGGTGAPSSQVKDYGVALTLSTVKPTRTGYTFLGWGTSASATTATYQPGGSYTANASITLYAVWKANTYTVTYNANGGSNAPAAQTKIHDVALTLSTTKPTRTNYEFLGWSTSATATTATYQPGGTYTGNGNVTLYAVWKLILRPTLQVGTASAKAGESVTVSVNIADNPGIRSFTLGFDYDTSRLKLVSAIGNSALGGAYSFRDEKLIWTSTQGSKHNGTLLILQFNVLATAQAGDASVTLTYNPGDIRGNDLEEVDFTICAGKVTVTQEHTHSYTSVVTSPTCTAQGYTTHTCTTCSSSYIDTYTNALGHSWGSGKVTQEPTEIVPGVRTYTCGRCSETKTESIPVLPASCDGTESCPSYPFVDVAGPAHWSHVAIDYALSNGLFYGASDTIFEPDEPMTRAMLVTVLWRYTGRPQTGTNNFTDVPNHQWYAQPVAWAAHEGIVLGVGNNLFEPNEVITREQLAAILFRYAKLIGINTNKRAELTAFSDRNSVTSYAVESLQWAVAEGLIYGSEGKLLPQGKATRAQVAAILMRFIENVAEE